MGYVGFDSSSGDTQSTVSELETEEWGPGQIYCWTWPNNVSFHHILRVYIRNNSQLSIHVHAK